MGVEWRERDDASLSRVVVVVVVVAALSRADKAGGSARTAPPTTAAGQHHRTPAPLDSPNGTLGAPNETPERASAPPADRERVCGRCWVPTPSRAFARSPGGAAATAVRRRRLGADDEDTAMNACNAYEYAHLSSAFDDASHSYSYSHRADADDGTALVGTDEDDVQQWRNVARSYPISVAEAYSQTYCQGALDLEARARAGGGAACARRATAREVEGRGWGAADQGEAACAKGRAPFVRGRRSIVGASSLSIC